MKNVITLNLLFSVKKDIISIHACVVKATNVLYITLKSMRNYVIIGLSITMGVGRMFQDIYKRIGFNLLKQGRLKGWTQEQLAKKFGVSRSRISKMEHGKENFNIESLFLLAQSLEIDYIELFK